MGMLGIKLVNSVLERPCLGLAGLAKSAKARDNFSFLLPPAPSYCLLLFPLLLLLFSNRGCSRRTCLPFSGLGLSTSLNLDHLRTILLAALHTLIQITTTTFLVRTYTRAPLTSLPPICRTSTIYCCPILMRRSCITRSQPHSGRPTCRKRHT
jgi:hypothetical protein